MRKKYMVIITCMLVAFLITACGSKIPDGMSEDTYNVGVKALEIMDKYNDGDLDSEEADMRLDSLSTKLDNLELDAESKSEYGLSEEAYNGFVKTYIESFQQSLYGIGYTDTYSKSDDLRDTLELK